MSRALKKLQYRSVTVYQRKRKGGSRRPVGYVHQNQKAVNGAPSPNGLGYHARSMHVGTVMAGADGNPWIVATRANGSRFWKPKQRTAAVRGATSSRRRMYKVFRSRSSSS